MLLIEHDMELALGLADRVTCLHNGAEVAEGTPDEIKADERVQDIYLGRDGGDARGPSIAYDGFELTGLASHQVARSGIGYVPQGRHVFPSLDVVKNLTVVARGDDGWSLDRVWDAGHGARAMTIAYHSLIGPPKKLSAATAMTDPSKTRK